MKQRMKRSVHGFVIGVFLIMTIGIILNVFSLQESMTMATISRNYLAGGIMGAIFHNLNSLYEKEQLSFLSTTAIHFVIMVVTFLFVGTWSEWLANDWYQSMIACISFLITYFIVWVMCYLLWKRDERVINQLLNKNIKTPTT